MNYRLFLLGALLGTLPVLLIAQDARLSNLAIRAQGGGGEVLITGFTISPGPNKTVLVRAAGPTLGTLGVGGTLPDPKLELYSGSTKIAENDNWNAADAASFASVGAFPFGAGSRDAAIVTTLAPGSYTAQMSGIGANNGVALVEVYELAGGSTRLINLSTRAHVGTGDNILIPGITVSSGAGTRRLLIRAVGPTLSSFGLTGTLSDPKLELLRGGAKVAENDNWETPMGSTTADAATLSTAFTQAGAFALGAGSRDAALLTNLGAGSYTLQVSGVGNAIGAALVEVYDLTPENQTGARPNAALYIARLRPDSAATSSTASGYATIAVNPDGSAFVNVSFSNLSSAITAAHLQLGTGRDYVFNLSLGQTTNALWTFEPTGAYTTNDLINALNTGNISVGLDSAKYPGGELRGNFITAAGSQIFTAPAAPPTLAADALTKPSQTDAARFLTQATFGPTSAEIDKLTAQGIPAWIDEQMALPMSSHLAGILNDVTQFPNPPVPATDPFSDFYYTVGSNRQSAWWKIVLTGKDQLRQRVAFALSEILVVSDVDDDLVNRQEALSKYYDGLANHAFGNFRLLLEEVTLSPVMGWWLSHLRNQKADPAKGTSPDENYAREVQQLFTIGLVQLHPDGTLILDENGQPIPTYDQAIVSDTAKILTGWAFDNGTTFVNPLNNFLSAPAARVNVNAPDTSAWMKPMAYFDTFHDKTQKRIVSLQQRPLAQATPTVVPANQTGPQDLKILLDTLFNHPNTGPFVCRQLIQRLVTSNPSPGYVYRAAQAFANDGTGTRGNLGAVVRTILTDYEARSPDVRDNLGYGKIKEPLLRVSGVFRVLKVSAPNGRFLDSYFGRDGRWHPGGLFTGPGDPRVGIGQMPLRAPTVFNFFSPDYVVPGPLAAAGLVAPEMEITDASLAIRTPNWINSFLFRAAPPVASPPAPSPSPFIAFDFAEFLPLARDPNALLDRLSLLFCANQLPSSTRNRVIALLQGVPGGTTDTTRIQNAFQMIIVSPDSALQR